jgi:hypothetical protein
MTDQYEMTPLFEAVFKFFDEEGWPVAEVSQESVLYLPFQGQHGQWMCYAQVRPELNQIMFYSYCPVAAPAERRAAVAELIIRINFNVAVGNFDLDYELGQIRYRTSLDLTGAQWDAALLRMLVYINVGMMDQYLPSILATCYGTAEPVAAATSE